MKKIALSNILLKETDHYVFIQKPPFISTLADRNDEHSIISIVRETYPEIKVGHRLDKQTSGVLALAKTDEAYRNLAIQFEKREVYKEYHAVVEGLHNFQEELVELPIQILAKGKVKIDFDEGKPSGTIISTLRIYNRHTLVQCEPVTGRMHQIRIHMSKRKAPLVGDITYGGSDLYLSSIKRKFNLKQDTEEQPLIKRVALHAHSLGFKDVDKTPLFVQAPYPKDFNVLVKQLEKNTRDK
ncbi:MAG: RluA family pseudouridine synthase [Cyclobacteriaceae bacterium]